MLALKSVLKSIFLKFIHQDFHGSWFALLLRFKYERTLSRLRKIYGRRKIVVGFCVSEISKWKSQFLYDCLAKTNNYRPIIFVYPSLLDFGHKEFTVEALLEEKSGFFADKGMDVVNVWDSVSNQCVFPEESRPDIVFYQQPWDIPPFPSPSKIAGGALTFYIPYYLINNFNIELELRQLLHRQVFGHIVQNEEVVSFFESKQKRNNYGGRLLGLGHTIVDNLTTRIFPEELDYVIYAPHFSFPATGVDRYLVYSTFLDNGKIILEFAKQHSNIKWVFKPHPRLKFELKHTGIWSDEEIDYYYSEWARIGTVCETPDYIEHFQKSSAMITDCGSFLTEYSCMDKPLIRLYYHKDNLPPNPILEKLYSTFYYAHNNDELMAILDMVICQHQDPHQADRNNEIVRLGLNRSDASERIINYIDSLLSSK
ncbi:MAG: hypothetical protein II989_05115 [Bacteroidales bacterium]|nr:hypothetical protein [Bacteroidales bacterium]